MSNHFGYIRVSTTKQGDGVSLIEQKSAIERYAAQRGFTISKWFQDEITAGKKGKRVQFELMMKELRAGKARGVIFHKLDRGTRNLHDWVNIGELVDAGIHVDFAADPMDLTSRGGRLSADIMAVVAADFIRNNRDEAKKGCYGRLKQGYWPLPAPIGYLDKGKAQAKVPDPIQAPLVQKLFELYDGGTFTIEQLVPHMEHLGFRNKRGGPVARSTLSAILNNPFYIGIMQLENGETFPGIHEPIVSPAVFKRVQERLAGKRRVKSWKHEYLFRRLLSCKTCHYSLVAERQKGTVYYRCHTKSCQPTSLREDAIDAGFQNFCGLVTLPEQILKYFEERLLASRSQMQSKNANLRTSLTMQLAQIKERTARLVDGYLDKVIDESMFTQKKSALLLEERQITEELEKLSREERDFTAEASKILELAKSAQLSYETGNPEQKRQLVKILTSNRKAEGKKLLVEPSLPFCFFIHQPKTSNGALFRARPRTFERMFQQFWGWITDPKRDRSKEG